MSLREKENNKNEGWREHSKLVLNELERLGKEQERLKKEINDNYNELKRDFTKVRELKQKVDEMHEWMDGVKEIMSTKQMDELRDEVYKQKNKWVAFAAILGFIQFVMGVAMVLSRIF